MRKPEHRGQQAVAVLGPWARRPELAVGESAVVVRLRLLSAPALVRSDGELVALERKDAALLALLAIDGIVRREQAGALLWPDADPQRARNSLRQRLFRLRRVARTELIEHDAALKLADGIEHDAAGLVERIAADPAAAEGELLAGFAYDDCEALDAWVRSARTRLGLQRRDALAAAAAAEESAGRFARALLYAERLVAEDPLSEQAHQLLMRLHYRQGDRASALAAYARCRALLLAELRAEPGNDTRELALLIKRSGLLPGFAARSVPTAVTHPPRLIGRDREWNELQSAWDGGRVALVVGDAGMGKTRLLADFTRSRAVPLIGARPGDERVPYALLARLLRALLPVQAGRLALHADITAELARILPELGSPPAGPLGEARFRQAVAQALTTSGAACAGVALDDLHFADLASLEMLPALVGTGLRWALAVRGAETPDPLAAWERAEGGGPLLRIALSALTVPDVRTLLESLDIEGVDLPSLAEPISQHTGGNPFFVLETAGALVTQRHPGGAPLPTTLPVHALIERRLEQLSAGALRLARIAALAGIDFTADLAAHALAVHPVDLVEPWNELESAHVLHGDGFAHDLVREVVLGAIPVPIARLLHRGLADCLVARNGPAARIAQHFEEASVWALAAQYHLKAADDALRASRRTEEADRREAAIACLDRAGDRDAAFDARYRSIECMILVRGVERAQRVIDSMLTSARSDAQRASALIARANAALMAADHVSGTASAREALRVASQARLAWDVPFEASRLLAVGLAQQGRAEEGEAVLLPFEAQVLEGSVELRGHYWADLAYVLNSARKLRRTGEALGRAMECARERGDLAELASLTSNFATVHGNLGQIALAHDYALRALALQAEIGDTGGPTGGVVESHVGLYGTSLGLYGAALEAFDRALACFRGDGQSVWIAVCSNNLAMAWIDLGQFARARKVLAYPVPAVSHVAARGAILSARVARHLGASPAADLERARAALTAGPDYYIGALLQLEAAHSLTAEEALRVCDSVRDAAEQREYGGVALKARVLGADAARRCGDRAEALARWHAAEALRATCQCADCYAPLADLVGIEILRACGELERAEALLQGAIAWIRTHALPHVPEPFRESFLQRNPVNRALLSSSIRRP